MKLGHNWNIYQWNTNLVLYPYNRLLPSKKKDVCNNVDASQNNYGKLKKLDQNRVHVTWVYLYKILENAN